MKKLPEQFTNQEFQMFFSGVEGNTHFNVAKSAGVRYMLMSYFHCKRKSRKFMEERFGDGQIKLLVDSGAHTFYGDVDEYKKKPASFWDDYITKYLEWAENNKQYLFAIVELDLDMMFGLEQVQKWRKKYFEPFEERTGIVVCYVYRTDQSIKVWNQMCKKYNYVGFSGTNDNADVALMKKLIGIAKRNNAVCHGFAMTKPSILPQLPFFSVDSISWKSGEMYGVTYVWDGKKLHTITKDKKEQARRRFKQKLIGQGCDWKLYSADDNNEVTRMSAIAWLEVMKWVRRRLKTKQYWLSKSAKPQQDVINPNPDSQEGSEEAVDYTEKVIVQKFKDIKFPKKKWFRGVMTDFVDVATALNIDPELYEDKEKIVELIKDVTYLLCDDYLDEAAERFTDAHVKDLCLYYFEVIPEDIGSGLSELYKLFKKIVKGKLPYFYIRKDREAEAGVDEAPPAPKERAVYVTDEDDGSDIEGMDEEILAKALVPRDEQGRFLPGHSIRKPKNLYSKNMPKLSCDTCYSAQSCSKFKTGYVCAYNKVFNSFDSRKIEDVVDMLASLTNMNASRIQRIALFETLEGGGIDPNLNSLIQLQLGLINNMRDLYNTNQGKSTFEMNIKASGDNSSVSNGLLEKIFNFNGEVEDTDDTDDNIIDVDIENAPEREDS